MKKQLQIIIQIALLILVFQIPIIKIWAQSNPTVTGPIGSQLAIGVNEDIKYWNGSAWIAIPSGLPGQKLTFTNGIPSWTTNPNGIITNAVTYLNGSTAICGGHIASSSGSPIIARGVCWSTNHNPTIADNFTSDDIGKGNFTSNLTGITNNTYYVRAYATNSAGTAYGNEVAFIPVQKPVYDIDGNGYDTVVIGTQTWMKQNLKTTHYRTGDAIPFVSSNSAWSILASGAYCNYNNDTNNGNTYGRLYNYYTISNLKGLCPTGWHTPSDAEWTTLTNYLGGENIAGGKLKEAGLSHWFSPNISATNESGFTALPGAYRNSSGVFYNYSYDGYWWSSTVYNSTTNAWIRYMDFNNSNVYRAYLDKKYGYSVRCIKDSVIIVVPVPVYDIDCNKYDTVVIGSQVWMKQNLKTTKYRNGDAIPNLTYTLNWSGTLYGAYCDYDNDTNNGNIYGRLYNFYTVADARNLCPTGWHVPTTTEWATLSTYLGGDTIAGGKLKEVGTLHWTSPNVGASNFTSFTALPGGYRYQSGPYSLIGTMGLWWSSTIYSSSNAWHWGISNTDAQLGISNNNKHWGFSIRCSKD